MYARQFVTLFSGKKSLAPLVAALFAASEQGGWLDWSDLSTLYQDSAGASPVTATGQPDGLVLDKSKALVRGTQLVTGWANGTTYNHTTFTPSGTGYVGDKTPAGIAGAASAASFTVVIGEVYEVTVVTSAASKTHNIALVIGADGAGGARSNVVVIPAGAGTTTALLTASSAGTTYLQINNQGSFVSNISVTSVSLKRVLGSHALQATSSSRPVLQQAGTLRYGALDGVDDRLATAEGGGASTAFMLGIAFFAGGAGTARVLWSDRGTNTGFQLELNTSDQIQFSGGNGSAFTTVTGDTITAGNAYVAIAYYDGAKLAIQVNQSAEVNTTFSTLSAGAVIVSIGSSKTPDKFFNGRIYGVIWRNNAINTPDQRAGLRAYLNSKAGIP